MLISYLGNASEQEISAIRAAINDANYCSEVKDCTTVGAACPIGCNIAVNVAHKENIQSILNNFESKCMYKCWHSNEVRCIENKCKVIHPNL